MITLRINGGKHEIGQAPAHVRIGWLRSVINIPHGYSINVFADELAYAANKDPLEYRLNLIKKNRIEDTKKAIKYDMGRLKKVLKITGKRYQNSPVSDHGLA